MMTTMLTLIMIKTRLTVLVTFLIAETFPLSSMSIARTFAARKRLNIDIYGGWGGVGRGKKKTLDKGGRFRCQSYLR